jgi:hypothetical protein
MPLPSFKKVFTYKHRGWTFPTLGFALRLHDQLLEASGGLPGVKMVMSLLGAGHIDREGLKHALILGCGLDLTDGSL